MGFDDEKFTRQLNANRTWNQTPPHKDNMSAYQSIRHTAHNVSCSP